MSVITRDAVMDRAICLHEAAHAVTGEALRPGCVKGVQMDYVEGTVAVFDGNVYAGSVEALCTWDSNMLTIQELLTGIAAGRQGENIAPDPAGWHNWGDLDMMRCYGSLTSRTRARRKAKSLVRRHELAIRRVAAALAERRTLTGDEIRTLIAHDNQQKGNV